jgi:hypothetical protein
VPHRASLMRGRDAAPQGEGRVVLSDRPPTVVFQCRAVNWAQDRPRTIEVINVFPKGCRQVPLSFPCLVSIPPGYPATTRLSHQWGEPEGSGGIILDRGRYSPAKAGSASPGWRPMPEGADDAFTLLTTEPGPTSRLQRPAGGDARARGLACVARSHAARTGAAPTLARRLVGRGTGAVLLRGRWSQWRCPGSSAGPGLISSAQF